MRNYKFECSSNNLEWRSRLFDLCQSCVRCYWAKINLHPSRKSEIGLRLLNLGIEEVSRFLTAYSRRRATCSVSRFCGSGLYPDAGWNRF